MNVTPLIDVLLVLLIIFMVITPVTSQGLDALAPQSADEQPARPEPERAAVVLMVAADGGVTINQEPLARREALGERLREIFATRAERVLFVGAAADVEYELVARVIDEARLVARVGLMPRRP